MQKSILTTTGYGHKAFKAAYKCQYAEYIVERFNEFGETPQKIDILKAISLIASAWDSITQETIRNCWRKANITEATATAVSIPPESFPTEENFIIEQSSACLHAFNELQELGDSDYQNFTEHFEDFFTN